MTATPTVEKTAATQNALALQAITTARESLFGLSPAIGQVLADAIECGCRLKDFGTDILELQDLHTKYELFRIARTYEFQTRGARVLSESEEDHFLVELTRLGATHEEMIAVALKLREQKAARSAAHKS